MTRSLVLGGWALVAASLVASEVASVLGGRHMAGLHDVLHALTARSWRRAAAVIGWAWLGWHFFAR